MSRRELWIPGPTEVRAAVREAMARPMIGHRGQDCKALVLRLREKLAPVFGAPPDRVLFETCPATMLMEAAVRNLVRGRMLVCANGAFSERWAEIGRLCGREVDVYDVGWGAAHDPAELARRLAAGAYDAVTITHNETSTGVLNPLAALAAAARPFKDALVLVDAVSSLGGAAVDFAQNGLDFCFAGVQKCLATPPGITVWALSERALARAELVPQRGWLFDFVRARKSLATGDVLATPSIPTMWALETSLDAIAAETLPSRFARHRAMAERTWAWAAANGLAMFPQSRETWSPTVSTVAAGRVNVERMLAAAKEKGFTPSDGYGKLKGRTFRIGHMGDHDLAALERLLAALDLSA